MKDTRPAPMSQVIAEYLKTREGEGYSPHTLEGYRIHLVRLTSELGDPALAEISLDDLRDHVASLKHLKATSRGTVVRAIRAFFKWAWEEGKNAGNPSVRLREPKQPDRVPKALTMEELERLRDSCKTIRERALLEVFFATGARLSELAGMNRASVDWSRRSILVMGKGSKEREVYLGARAAIWLERYLSGRDDRVAALFVTSVSYATERGGHAPRRLSGAAIGSEVKRVAKRCGLEARVSPHVLRHTLATSLLNQGAPITTVQSILGHAKPETTMVYVNLSGSARQRDFERFFVQ